MDLAVPSTLNVLIASDDPVEQFFIERHLRGSGYDTRVSRAGSVALECARQDRPDVVLLDSPGLVAHFQSDPRLVDIFIVMLSPAGDREQRLHAFHHGVADFVSTPIEAGELLARMKMLETMISMRRELTHLREKSTGKQTSHAGSRQTTDAVDPLTGLVTRQHALKMLNEIWVAVLSAPVSAALIDVDGLRNVNGRHGMSAGDQVLRTMGGVVAQHARALDIVCRFGGDELLIVMPNQVAEQARVSVTRCCHAFDEALGESLSQNVGTVTTAFGVVERSHSIGSPDAMLMAVERALADAKAIRDVRVT